MSKIILFGEIMLRLSPEGFNRFIQSDKFNVTYGGSEANVAVSLSNFNMKTDFVSCLPDNEIAHGAINSLKSFGVGVSNIFRMGNRMGIYFLEKGASQRPSKIIYDRENSSFSLTNEKDFNWDKIFEDANWFHFSGITPALSDNIAQTCLNACKIAKNNQITISCDINYRKNLWDSEKANKVMTELMKYVDICIVNEEDAENVFGIKYDCDVDNGILNKNSYKNVAKIISDRFNCSLVAITLRTSISANDNKWAAMLYDNNKFYFSEEYNIHIVDRVGGGDSFAAGLIYGLMNDINYSDVLDFAVASSSLKHSIEGDFNLVSVKEVNRLVNGKGTGRIQR